MADARICGATVAASGFADDLSEAWFLRDSGESRTALCGRGFSVSLCPGRDCNSTNWMVIEKPQTRLVQSIQEKFGASSYLPGARYPWWVSLMFDKL